MTQYPLLFHSSRDVGDDIGAHPQNLLSSSSLSFTIRFQSPEQHQQDTLMMDAQDSDYHSDDGGLTAVEAAAAAAGSFSPMSASGTSGTYVPNYHPRQPHQQQQQQNTQYSAPCTTQSPALPQEDAPMVDYTGAGLDADGYYNMPTAETTAPPETLPGPSQPQQDQDNLDEIQDRTSTSASYHPYVDQQLAVTASQTLSQLQEPGQGQDRDQEQEQEQEQCREFQVERKYSPSISPPPYPQQPVSVCPWPSTPTDYDNYEYTLPGSTTSDAAAGPNTVTLLQTSSSNNNNAGGSPRSWSIQPQAAQQQLHQQDTTSWLSRHNQPQHPYHHHHNRQPQTHSFTSGICTPMEELRMSPTSQAASPYLGSTMSSLNRPFDASTDGQDISYANYPPATATSHAPPPFQLGCHGPPSTADGLPHNPSALSPCSISMALAGRLGSREASAAVSEEPDVLGWPDDLHSGAADSPHHHHHMMDSRYSSADPAGAAAALLPSAKTDEPYAQLIYKAFMSRPNRAMTLQEIYQWFRENTEKAKSEGKGWQNSIRHNLSMNGAFTKRCIKTVGTGSDACISIEPASGADGRKSTEWFLEPEFYVKGVESTTRYRTPKASRRSAAMSATRFPQGGGGAAYHHQHQQPSATSHSRVAAGRKGGFTASSNKKRLKQQQQQQQLQAQQAHHQRMQGYHAHHVQQTSVPPGYPAGGGGGGAGGGGDKDPYESYYAGEIHNPWYATPHGRGYHPPTTSSNDYDGGGFGGVARQQAGLTCSPHHGGSSSFDSHDLPLSAGFNKRSSTLKSAEDNDLPVTPGPADSLAAPPDDHHFHKGPGGYGYAARHPHHQQSPTSAYGGGGGHAPQQQQYSLADVHGVYEGAGSVHAPLFVDQDEMAADGTLFAGYSGYHQQQQHPMY